MLCWFVFLFVFVLLVCLVFAVNWFPMFETYVCFGLFSLIIVINYAVSFALVIVWFFCCVFVFALTLLFVGCVWVCFVICILGVSFGFLAWCVLSFITLDLFWLTNLVFCLYSYCVFVYVCVCVLGCFCGVLFTGWFLGWWLVVYIVFVVFDSGLLWFLFNCLLGLVGFVYI